MGGLTRIVIRPNFCLNSSQLGPQITGKIALWSAQFERRELLKYRPLAVIGIGPRQGIKPRRLHRPRRAFGPYDPAPMFWIAREDGLRLLQAGARTAKVHLCSERHPEGARNIIAELIGYEQRDEIVVICGHYDSVPDVAGATDNTFGIDSVMEFSRLYAQRGSKRTLRFIAWDTEEGGYASCVHYAKTLHQQNMEERTSDDFVERRDKIELDRHLLCMNLDTLGTTLGHNSCYVLGSPDLTATIKVLSKELGAPYQLKEDLDPTDYLLFAWIGVRAIGFVSEGPLLNYIHMVEDNIDILDVSQLQLFGRNVSSANGSRSQGLAI